MDKIIDYRLMLNTDKDNIDFMLLIEEFTVDSAQVDSMLELIEEALVVIENLELPFLKYVRAYQCPDEPNKFRALYEIGDRSDFELFNEKYGAYKDGALPKRFFSIVKKENYSYSFFDEVGSV